MLLALHAGGLAAGWRPGLARTGAGPATTQPVARPLPRAAAAAPAPVFPLAAKPGRRHLVDAAGQPFLIHGDTAWSLIAQLTQAQVERYLDDRRARGFNTILVSLIENYYSADPPSNAYGERPFHSHGVVSVLPFGAFPDYTTPNEAYFAYADWVLRQAAESGILVLLAPSYVGCCADGWHEAMVANGSLRLRQYGDYLGRRYRDFTNILWVHGGDSNAAADLARAVADGIRQSDPCALHTAHGAPETAALDYWPDGAGVQVNNVYTYGPVHAPALAQYARAGRMPFFLIESAYENEHRASEQRLRTQAYQAVLSGAAGQVFGNNPIWHFNGKRRFWSRRPAWHEVLGSRGAHSMSHLRDLLTAMRWWLLAPDTRHSLLTGGRGPEDARAAAARSADGSFAVVYLPSARDITLDLGQMTGPMIAAEWFDPAAGRVATVAGSPFPAAGPRRFRPVPARNDAGFEDWVLILQAQA